MQYLVTIGCGVWAWQGVEFPISPLTCVVALTTLQLHQERCVAVTRWMMMRLQVLKYRNKTFDGMSTMSYSIHSIERRAFYTYIHANLNGW